MAQAASHTDDHPIDSRDAVDNKILNLLQEDSRLSFNKVADKIGVSVGTAYNRIKHLEAKGLLKGYIVLLDPIKLGYGLTAIIMVQAEGGHLVDVETAIAENKCVTAVYDVTGDSDAVVIAKFKDRNSMNLFVKHLLTSPHVKRTVTNIALNTIKEDFRVKLP